MTAHAIPTAKLSFVGARFALDKRAELETRWRGCSSGPPPSRTRSAHTCVASASPLGPAVSITPYFEVPEANLEAFKNNVVKGFYPLVANERKCILYNFTFSGTTAHCREVYEDAEGLLFHLGNVDAALKLALDLAPMTKIECHGPAEELAKLKEPLKDLPVVYFTQL